MSKRPQARGVSHRIEIAAPPSAVWSVLADLDHWGAWNPLYIQAAGEPVVGARFAMTIALEGMKPQKAQATIVSVEPETKLEYAIVNLGGLVKAFRYIDLRAIAANRCEVVNGEIMTGLVGRLLARLVGGKVRNGLQAMNEALKARVEAQSE
jgi:hypothetical protein